ITSILAFTSPGNAAIFGSFGYRIIAAAEGEAILLEKGGGLDAWCAQLAASVGPEAPRAIVVMNCNPFTLGHLHLVREAAKRHGRLAVIVVSEEASSFPYEARLRMVREGTAGIPGVVVLPGSDYIVSRATFPTYFLKDKAGRAATVHARLDLDLFGRRIAPALGADVRFVGEEPYSEVTALYNAAMKSVLPSLGIEVVEIPRLRSGGAAVSASTVRAAIRDGKLEDARSLVPESTWGYLNSPEAKPVLRAVAVSAGRH
ncbi:MAG: hypothetical protein Q8M76_18400, partial [Spirochaetaceae bacterium]|nr:hypothetical protein [Spirochaetaceae bacterium]